MNALAPQDTLFTGKLPAPDFEAHYVRDLSAEDTLILESASLGVKTPALKRLRDHHHKVAELQAQGFKPGDISQITGMCLSRLSILKNDPAFIELVAYYKGEYLKAAVKDFDRIQMVSRSATAILQERMDDMPELLETKDLIKIAEFGADRTGHGPTANLNTRTMVISSDDLHKLKEEASAHGVSLILPQDREARARLAHSGGAPTAQGGPEDQRGKEGP